MEPFALQWIDGFVLCKRKKVNVLVTADLNILKVKHSGKINVTMLSRSTFIGLPLRG